MKNVSYITKVRSRHRTTQDGQAPCLRRYKRYASETDFGILCLTRENLEQPWILFEAGALAKRVQDNARVVPYLIDDISFAELDPPLGLFQANKSDREGT